MVTANCNHSDISTEKLSVLTLNLRFGLADDGDNSWPHRKHILPALFRNYPTDIVGLQEANDFQIAYMDHILADHEFIGKRSPAPRFWQNNIIFYKKTWKCVYHDHFFLSPTPDIPSRFRDSRWPRQCTIGMFAADDRKIICATTHFDFTETVQVNSARLILERLASLPPGVPVILMGDFNAAPSSSCHLIFTGEGVKNQPSNFKNVFKKPYPATYHGFTGRVDGECIDWILYRGRIMAENCKVILDSFNGRYPSDHFPVYTSFRWCDAKH